MKYIVQYNFGFWNDPTMWRHLEIISNYRVQGTEPNNSFVFQTLSLARITRRIFLAKHSDFDQVIVRILNE